jgi:hypothetical protein
MGGCNSLDALFDSRGSSPLFGQLACGQHINCLKATVTRKLTVTCPKSCCRLA